MGDTTKPEAWEAGRSFDAWIAEHVMECRVEPPRHAAGGLGTDYRMWEPCKNRRTDAIPLPEYSTRMVDAWKVADYMRTLGYSIQLHNATTGGLWSCRFKSFGQAILADSAELAICRAAAASIAKTKENK